MNIIFVGLLICVIFIAQSTTTNPNLDDKLTDKEIENSVQCYEPSQDRENFCSVFPFRTTVGGPLQQSTLALISASAICDKAENLLHVHKIFGCYVGLGICHPGKTWSIPKGSSVDGFKEMLRTQTFKVVGNTDKREPVMCKSTCKQAIDLIMSALLLLLFKCFHLFLVLKAFFLISIITHEAHFLIFFFCRRKGYLNVKRN
ncbi:hypothetical protein HMI55_002745 [Coelomomyces lativittatus]|nr:hypothetical protein HMI55_002745 [Coelomomyces lativittatus]